MARNHDLMAAEINRHSRSLLNRIDELERALRNIQADCSSDNEHHDIIVSVANICFNAIGPKTQAKERG
jgi:molecular chaperone GrpE (heat shock protein)